MKKKKFQSFKTKQNKTISTRSKNINRAKKMHNSDITCNETIQNQNKSKTCKIVLKKIKQQNQRFPLKRHIKQYFSQKKIFFKKHTVTFFSNQYRKAL